MEKPMKSCKILFLCDFYYNEKQSSEITYVVWQVCCEKIALLLWNGLRINWLIV